MNATAEKFYPKKELLSEAEQLLKSLKKEIPIEKSYRNYLEIFRNLERNFN